jgi:NRPS condensation-like uncharacterized protein
MPDEGSMVSANFAMVVRVRGDFSVEQLQDALARVRPRHRLLVARVDPEDPAGSSSSPESAPRFPLRMLDDCAEADWKEVAKAELRRSTWDKSGPFARFILLRLEDASDIVGVFNHSICDGMSGMYFLRDILQILGDPKVELPPIPTPPSSFTLIPPSVAENPRVRRQVNFIVTMMKVSLYLQRLRRRFLPKARQSKPVQQFDEDNLPPAQRFCIIPRGLTASQTKALIERCRAEQTSVHAAVCIAWLRAFANQLEDRKSWKRRVSSPVNLRERLPRPVGDTAGLFMSTVETRVDCAPGRDFWQTARQLKQDLNEGTTDEKAFMMPMLFGAVFTRLSQAQIGDAVEYFFGRPVKYDFSITNIGRLVIPLQNGPLQVEAFYGPLVNSSEYERTVGVNTLGDQMNFSYIFRESIMAPQQGQLLIEQAIEQLAKAVGW